MCDACGPDRSRQVIDHSITHPFVLEPDTDLNCATCGQHVAHHPDKMEFLRRRETDAILDHGHQVRMVFDPDAEDAPFVYTVGRALHGKPELFMTGPVDPRTMAGLLNDVAEIESLYDGQKLDQILAELPVLIHTIGDLEAAEMHGVVSKFPGATAFQVLLPDAAGLFPGEAGYDEAGFPQGVMA